MVLQNENTRNWRSYTHLHASHCKYDVLYIIFTYTHHTLMNVYVVIFVPFSNSDIGVYLCFLSQCCMLPAAMCLLLSQLMHTSRMQRFFAFMGAWASLSPPKVATSSGDARVASWLPGGTGVSVCEGVRLGMKNVTWAQWCMCGILCRRAEH